MIPEWFFEYADGARAGLSNDGALFLLFVSVIVTCMAYFTYIGEFYLDVVDVTISAAASILVACISVAVAIVILAFNLLWVILSILGSLLIGTLIGRLFRRIPR